MNRCPLQLVTCRSAVMCPGSVDIATDITSDSASNASSTSSSAGSRSVGARVPVVFVIAFRWWCANDVINVASGAASASLPARRKGCARKAYCRLLHLTCLIVRRYPATPSPSLLYCRTAAADKVATSSTAYTITRSAGMMQRMREGGGGTAEASY